MKGCAQQVKAGPPALGLALGLGQWDTGLPGFRIAPGLPGFKDSSCAAYLQTGSWAVSRRVQLALGAALSLGVSVAA